MRELKRRLRELNAYLKIDYIMLTIVLGVMCGVGWSSNYSQEIKDGTYFFGMLSVLYVMLNITIERGKKKKVERAIESLRIRGLKTSQEE